MKKLLPLLIVLLLISRLGYSFTNVSGGIYSNTTWTKANSPYIVTDTIVVFPGVTLTIQPGVVVKFDTNMYIEIRQATILAVGTPTDSITFTANSPTPVPGSWGTVELNGVSTTSSSFNYCSFSYATAGINGGGWTTVVALVKNCNFKYNIDGVTDMPYVRMDTCNFYYNSIGINGAAGALIYTCNFIHNSSIGISQNFFGDGDTIKNCVVEYSNVGMEGLITGKVIDCIIKYNNWGVTEDNEMTTKNCIIDSNKNAGYLPGPGAQDSIIGCKICYNRVGIADSIGSTSIIRQNIIQNNVWGISMGGANQISCNSICSNSKYDLNYYGTSNVSATHNYWCTTDSASTRKEIYDGYTDISYGLVYILPLDSSCSPAILTNVNNLVSDNTIKIYPNPAHTLLNIETNGQTGNICLYNSLGEQIMCAELKQSETAIPVNTLSAGIYYYRVTDKNGALIKSDKVMIVR